MNSGKSSTGFITNYDVLCRIATEKLICDLIGCLLLKYYEGFWKTPAVNLIVTSSIFLSNNHPEFNDMVCFLFALLLVLGLVVVVDVVIVSEVLKILVALFSIFK